MSDIVNTSSATSETIMATLVRQTASTQRRESLVRLEQACSALRTANSPVHIKSVERQIAQTHGKDVGPKAQSISNEKNRPLGMYHYVMACERERAADNTSTKERARPLRRSVAVENNILGIKDADLRSSMLDILDQYRVAQDELERAKALLKTIRPGADISSLLDGKSPPVPKGIVLSKEQYSSCRDVLDALTNDARLSRVGLVNDGKRVKRKGGTGDELIVCTSIAVLAGIIDAAAT